MADEGARIVQWRGGNSLDMQTFTGADREITVDTTTRTLVVHDGVTPGGSRLALENANGNLPVQSLTVANIVTLTQDEYDALVVKDGFTLYFIVPPSALLGTGFYVDYPSDLETQYL